jgi:hypothetical protein
MTAKPPSTSTLTPDTANEITATVTFDEIRDSIGTLVGNNSVTFDPVLELKGTAAKNKALNIRDYESPISEVTSGNSGNWSKQLNFEQGFKRYRLDAIERDVPQDFSLPYYFVFATETPIIEKVTGKDGPIESGATYDGDLLEFSGYAPPNMEVEAFNDDTSTGKKAPVDQNGSFKLTLDGLTAGSYNIKIRAANGKESAVFAFKVVFDVALSIDDVVDSNGSIAEGGTTYEDKVTVSGYARPGEEVQLRNNNVPVSEAKATAREGDGYWKIEIDVTPDSYSLTVEALYGDGEITTPPRTFNMESIVKPYNTRVHDTDGPIEDNGSTRYNYVTVRGDAAPLEAIKLKINGVIDSKPEPTDNKGKWARVVQNLNHETTYQFIAVADYGDNAESNSWTVTTEKQDIKPSIEDVKDSHNTLVPPGSSTRDVYLTVKGKAAPGKKVRLLDGTRIIGEPEANGDGDWVQPITAPTEFISLTAKALYGEGETSSPAYTFDVIPFGELVDIIDPKNNSIPENGTTVERSLSFVGKASPNHTVEVWNGNQQMPNVIAGEKGIWIKHYDLSPGRHSITIKVKDAESSPPRTFSVIKRMTINRVTDGGGNPILDGGSIPSYHRVMIYVDDAAPNSSVTLRVNDIDLQSSDADHKGAWRWDGFIPALGLVLLTVKDIDGHQSLPWTITVTR